MDDRIELAEMDESERIDDRRRLATAIEWKPGPLTYLPDPFTDANDCNALIKHLRSMDYEPKIDFRVGYVVITMHDTPRILEWQGDNWMNGVCELALKALK